MTDCDSFGSSAVTATRYCAPATPAEIERFTPFLFELLDASFAEISARFLRGIEVDDKDNGTPVTQADKQAEAVMRKLIEARYPKHGIFGEEFGIKESEEVDGVRYRWILDPIDGTRSFITNSFLFGTLIALERDDGAGFRPIRPSVILRRAYARWARFRAPRFTTTTASVPWFVLFMCATALSCPRQRFWQRVTGRQGSKKVTSEFKS